MSYLCYNFKHLLKLGKAFTHDMRQPSRFFEPRIRIPTKECRKCLPVRPGRTSSHSRLTRNPNQWTTIMHTCILAGPMLHSQRIDRPLLANHPPHQGSTSSFHCMNERFLGVTAWDCMGGLAIRAEGRDPSLRSVRHFFPPASIFLLHPAPQSSPHHSNIGFNIARDWRASTIVHFA